MKLVKTPLTVIVAALAAGGLAAPAAQATTQSASAAPTGPMVDFTVGPRYLTTACQGTSIRTTQNAAAVIAAAPAGTTFCFAAGTHRIGQTLKPKNGDSLVGVSGALLTGSISLPTWTATGGQWRATGHLPAAYAASGQCENNVANICGLREQIFVNGVHLTRVASQAAVKAGTFYANYATNAIYLGSDPTGKAVEMSKTGTAIQSTAVGVTVRGLAIEHFASAPQGGALVVGKQWYVWANDVRWNHAVGIMMVTADNARVLRNNVHHNGQLGMGQYKAVSATISRNYITANNTDGFWIADWESGGLKTTWSTGGSVLENMIHNNLGVGLWSDAYDDKRLFSGNSIRTNAADGIRFEIGRNGVIEKNWIAGNGFGTGRNSGTSLWDGGGINVNTSNTVAVRNNSVVDNVNGVSIQSRTRGTGPWGTNVLRDVTVSGNFIRMHAGVQSTGMVQNGGSPIPAGEVVLSANQYRLDSLTAKRFQRAGVWYTPATWARAGLDVGSTYAVG
jgi:hypothetical protein